ncbi:hypothetical protein F5Y16DRAFT_169506 [Xylariaceae sp. FL0255]|nr:hypothetical protein F5Y16DRAFT_169506 [Xylariaceae sp. FL0255]
MEENTEGTHSSSSRSPTGRRPSSLSAIWLVISLLCIINLTSGITNIPVNRLLEQRLCKQYYDSDHDVDEERCKVDEIQQQMAWIMGALETLWTMGDFLVAIPLSFVAERYGRRVVLGLNLVPRFFMLLWILTTGYLTTNLPPQAAIAAASLSFLGGDAVFNSLIYSLAAAAPQDDVTRTVYFSWMTALTSVIGFLSPALAASTMTVQISLPFWLGLLLLLLAIPIISLVPPVDTRAEDQNPDQRPLISSPILKAQASSKTIGASVLDRVRLLVSFFNHIDLALLLVSMFLTSVASADTKLLAQYISKRYRWTFASAGYLLSAKAAVNFVLLSILVPLFLATRQQTPPSLSDRANTKCARFCLLASIVGAFAIGVAATTWELVPSLLIYAMGVPLSIFTLSLANSPKFSAYQHNQGVTGNPQAHVFSIVMMVKTLGSLVGAPFMAACWFYGIKVGFYGSPYIASSVMYLAAFGVFWRIGMAHQ